MTYFISQPLACRSYAKCHGWQETLAHFFVKTRRSSLAQLLPHRNSSQDVLLTYIKDQSLDSSQESSILINTTNNNNQQLTLTPSIFDISPNLDEVSTEKQIDIDLTQTCVSSEQSLTSNSADISMDILTNNKDSTSDIHGYSNDTIMTPPLSISTSREDLLSLLKIENSNDNLIGIVRNNSDLSSPLPRTTTSPSTTQFYHDNERNEELKRFSSALRELLG
jgi:hypothetical protein